MAGSTNALHAAEVYAGSSLDAVITVLIVMPDKADQKELRRMLPAPRWLLYRARTLGEGFATLRRHQNIPVVLCEQNLQPGTWAEMLEYTAAMEDPPLVIVASRLADERLWAEALNLGAHDVLAKPFNVKEVHWAIVHAWIRWQRSKTDASRKGG